MSSSPQLPIQTGWSLARLLEDQGADPLRRFHAAYPMLQSQRYDLARLDLDAVLGDADLLIVHD